jgi:hypothetical protein
MWSRVLGSTISKPRNARDTVAADTPAATATSRMVSRDDAVLLGVPVANDRFGARGRSAPWVIGQTSRSPVSGWKAWISSGRTSTEIVSPMRGGTRPSKRTV